MKNSSERRVQLSDYFEEDYHSARTRFVRSCAACGAEHHRLLIAAKGPRDQPLSIDVGIRGPSAPRKALVISSGLHGVEAPLGSAVQLAALDRLVKAWPLSSETAIIMLHVLNPFGFAWRRRFNENNVDLNRNFLLANQPYAGAPEHAEAFRRILGAPGKPNRLRTARLRIGFLAARYGLRSFWETLPVGQYELANWLFFGGRQLAQTGKLLKEFLPGVLGTAGEVCHLDFHTGLGRWGVCELLLSEGESAGEVKWWRTNFPEVKIVEPTQATRYVVRGGFGPWLRSILPGCQYHFATAEFGTYSPLRVLNTLADETRWTNAVPHLAPDHWSRRRLAEVFAPRSEKWRTKTANTGLELVERAASLLR